MRSKGYRAGILVFAMTLGPLAAAAQEGIKEVDEAWKKAMKANDLEAIVACYAPDAVLWLPDAPEARGAKAIREVYAGLLAGFSVVDVSVSYVGDQTAGELSTGWGNFTLTLQPKDGSPVISKGRFTAVSKKIGGKWLYVADHASNDPAPAPPKV